MIDYAKPLHDEYGMSQYVTYGGKWFRYFYRRVMERKGNLRFAARAPSSPRGIET
ncbi:hypothetical protein MBEHAL_0201 [Halarchaeum acidiphilum MH1-52-1]|uniref:Uncharacterized protein n=1 Tax=Halarchaeum acidiphilum MH1-52-1 TaxID=1261545 RepID=U2YCU3_9EURY|nr:hypothetical protein MBEHAL_0201 [Halarchaeum acidiphilum MH1-52-1]